MKFPLGEGAGPDVIYASKIMELFFTGGVAIQGAA